VEVGVFSSRERRKGINTEIKEGKKGREVQKHCAIREHRGGVLFDS